MIFGSICSGIEAATVAWAPLGWKAAWLAEIEAFPSAVLAHHYPETPNLGDMTKIERAILCREVIAPDLLCGGTPCQAFSIAGLRESLDDARGNLTLKFVELANAIDYVRASDGREPAIVFWENVPGVLSTHDNAFGCFLAGLAGENGELEPPEPKPKEGKSSRWWKWNRKLCRHTARWANAGAVYGPSRAVAWRIMDAQYLGVAQRRRRVFVVASARNGFDPAEVLFEWQGVRRDIAPRRGQGEDAAAGTVRSTDGGVDVDHVRAQHVVATIDASFGRLQGASGQDANHGHSHLISFGGNNTSGPIDVATGVRAKGGTGHNDFESETFVVTHSLRGEGFDASEDGTGRGTPLIAFDSRQDPVHSDRVFGALGSSSPQAQAIQSAMQVRRLTPRECERLQGFPDDYTAVPWGGKPADKCPDGPRYKSIGNSWAVPNVRWLGRRIEYQLKKLEKGAR